jgi:hypothetical protein
MAEAFFQKYFFDAENGIEKMHDFNDAIQDYCLGILSVEDVYEKLTGSVFPALNFQDSSPSDDKTAWDLFVNVLHSVYDPERRTNLHLRYLRDRPRIHTLCCSKEHCFTCRLKGFHDGKSCPEIRWWDALLRTLSLSLCLAVSFTLSVCLSLCISVILYLSISLCLSVSLTLSLFKTCSLSLIRKCDKRLFSGSTLTQQRDARPQHRHLPRLQHQPGERRYGMVWYGMIRYCIVYDDAGLARNQA